MCFTGLISRSCDRFLTHPDLMRLFQLHHSLPHLEGEPEHYTDGLYLKTEYDSGKWFKDEMLWDGPNQHNPMPHIPIINITEAQCNFGERIFMKRVYRCSLHAGKIIIHYLVLKNDGSDVEDRSEDEPDPYPEYRQPLIELVQKPYIPQCIFTELSEEGSVKPTC
ncbi:unnamed protein product [Arabis nemorensis]|uniref:Uncharacterized protein n=1 Tax=Arabis nemorensis TaxID=586526 RepID=A0A565CDU9_9BRAS|nr:unnamed protein product [Arabis nemorensis]